MYARTFQIFNGITHNRDVINRCCSQHTDPTGCGISFANTQLNIIRGLSHDSHEAHMNDVPYHSDVEVSEGALLGCRDIACIQHLLYHELGHRCSQIQFFSRDEGTHSMGVLESNALYSTSLGCSTSNGRRQLFERLVGRETWQCIEDRIRATGTECNSARIEEMFADALFLPKWKNLNHYAWDCHSRPDESHPPPDVYMPCLLAMPGQHEILCRDSH